MSPPARTIRTSPERVADLRHQDPALVYEDGLSVLQPHATAVNAAPLRCAMRRAPNAPDRPGIAQLRIRAAWSVIAAVMLAALRACVRAIGMRACVQTACACAPRSRTTALSGLRGSQ